MRDFRRKLDRNYASGRGRMRLESTARSLSRPRNRQFASITGRERIGWDQAADSPSELATFVYAIYVDGVRNLLADTSCATAAGSTGFACSGRLPALSNGSHTLQLAAFVDAGDGDIVESSRSTSLTSRFRV